MTPSPPDGSSSGGSRDRRIEDPSNLWLIHPASRALLPFALRSGISANMVSVAGLILGAGAAIAYAHWQDWRLAIVGLVLSVGWLIADGLDGMVARATGTSSALGRFLDGICDHGVFTLIYVSLAASIGTAGGWALAIVAGVAHAVQSSLYEGERARFHRRIRGVAVTGSAAVPGNVLVRLYDLVAGSLDRVGLPFERALARADNPVAFGAVYGRRSVPAMRIQSLLSANVRVQAIFVACLIGNPRLFWWFEIIVLSAVAIVGIARHRRVEAVLAGDPPIPSAGPRRPIFSFLSFRKQGNP